MIEVYAVEESDRMVIGSGETMVDLQQSRWFLGR